MRPWARIAIGLGAVLYLAYLYFNDPEQGGFLACPIHVLTGLLCPGCGSQRALHDLMHFRGAEALAHNAALVVGIPLLCLQWGHDRSIPGTKPLSSRNSVVLMWILLIVGWAILRNLAFHFPLEH